MLFDINELFSVIENSPQEVSVCTISAVLFEVSCKSISRKSFSLIKIEYCLRGHDVKVGPGPQDTGLWDAETRDGTP